MQGAPVPRHVLRFEATVFQVAMPRDRVIELDAAKLAADAPTPAKLAEALKPFGAPQALCRVDQLVATGQPAQIRVSADVPYVSGRARTSSGASSASISRNNAGVNFSIASLAADDAPPQRPTAQIEVEISTMTDSSARGDDDVVPPTFWRVNQTCSCAQTGRPVVLLSAGPAAASTQEVMAYVTLLSLSVVPDAP